MQNLQNMASFKQARKEKGFTIIELVVVILLLGILSATALPRFMDVTDEAHTTVVNAVEGGLHTGASLFRAQWFSKGQPVSPAVVTEFGDAVLAANLVGYPDIQSTSANCQVLFEQLLQAGGAPQVTAFELSAGTVTPGAPALPGGGVPTSDPLAVVIGASVTSANIASVATADFVAVKSNGGGTVYCKNDGTDFGCSDGFYYASSTSAALDAAFADDGTGAFADLGTALDTFADNGGSCTFYYTGQYKVAALGLDASTNPDNDTLGLHTLSFSLTTGVITRSITAFEP
jgi:prepilin-type N-terminal cleavage/methylation domain-containing protein